MEGKEPEEGYAAPKRVFHDIFKGVVSKWPAADIEELCEFGQAVSDDACWLALREGILEAIGKRNAAAAHINQCRQLSMESTASLRRHADLLEPGGDLKGFVDQVLEVRAAVEKACALLLHPDLDIAFLNAPPESPIIVLPQEVLRLVGHQSVHSRVMMIAKAASYPEGPCADALLKKPNACPEEADADMRTFVQLGIRRMKTFHCAHKRLDYVVRLLRCVPAERGALVDAVRDAVMGHTWTLPRPVDGWKTDVWMACVRRLEDRIPGAIKAVVHDPLRRATEEIQARPPHVPTIYMPAFQGGPYLTMGISTTAGEVNMLVCSLYQWASPRTRGHNNGSELEAVLLALLKALLKAVDARLAHVLRAVTNFPEQVIPDDMELLRNLQAAHKGEFPESQAAVLERVPKLRKRNGQVQWADRNVRSRVHG